MKRRHSGFTFVELLVVIGIIALLIGLLLPALSKAREQSKATRCASQLHQLFLAQTFYSNDNGGHYTPVMNGLDDDKWWSLLVRYVSRDPELPAKTLFQCPTASEDLLKPRVFSYGMNSCVMLENWRTRRDRKCNSSEIILMGEKPVQMEEYLTSDDGYFVSHREGQDTDLWIHVLGHRSRGTYRHAGGTTANMVMLDGHVVAMTRSDLAKESGHWYWGKSELPVIDGVFCICP